VARRALVSLLLSGLAALALLASGSAARAAPPGKAKVWFAPLPPDRPGTDASFVGSEDFMALFSPRAPWKRAAGRVDVFKLYGGWVARGTTDAWLRRAVGDLKRRGIRLAVEEGPLRPTEDCGLFVEGFAGEEGVAVAQRVKDAGGTLRFLAYDEPYYYASIYDGPQACHWSAERIAGEIAAYNEEIRGVFGAIRFGDTEPLTSALDVPRYESWIDTYRRVAGEPLAFFHVDVSFSLPGWPALVRELELHARSRGVPFGVIYMGEHDDRSDEEWLARAQRRFEHYETEAGGRPDHAVLQSWHDRPDRVLPETSLGAFTSLVNRYARSRTALTLALDDGTVSGRLRDARGRPLPRAPVAIAVVPRYEGGVLPAAPLVEIATTTDATGSFEASLGTLPALGVAVQARYAGTSARWPAFAATAVGDPGRNVARGRHATASAAAQSPAGQAVDGSYETAWGAGADAPQWLEIDLGQPATIGQLRLVVAQFPAGETHHVVYGRDAAGALRMLAELRGETDDGDVLTITPPAPWTGMRALRIETLASPSWVAWREVEAWSW
jgi:hypothetical protein